MLRKTKRFQLALNADDREVIRRLAEYERMSASAALRRAAWEAARERGLLPIPYQQEEASDAE